MRKVILNVAVTLDGLIEGANGEYDWCFTGQDYGMNDFLQGIDTILFGRKSYDLLQKVDPGMWNEHRKIVFSNTLAQAKGNAEIITGNIEQTVQEMKQQDGKDIWLFGGASLTTSLMDAKLVDQLFLSIHPIILGAGKPLFQNIHQKFQLKLTDTKTYPNGLLQTWYDIIHTS